MSPAQAVRARRVPVLLLALAAALFAADGSRAVFAGGRLIATVSAGPPLVFGPGKGDRLCLRAELPPDRSAAAVLCLPYRASDHPAEGVSLDLAGRDFTQWKDRTAGFWEDFLARGAKLEVPEPEVLQSYSASLVCLLIGRGRGEPVPEERRGEFSMRDAAYRAASLTLAGYMDEARRSLELFPRWQKRSGQFAATDGRPDGTGCAVWALVEYGLLSGDDVWLDRIYPLIAKSAAFILTSRRSGRAGAPLPDMPSGPAGGNEDDRVESSPGPGCDWWSLRTLQSAALAARRLGRLGDAAAWESEFEDLRTAVLRPKTGRAAPGFPRAAKSTGPIGRTWRPCSRRP